MEGLSQNKRGGPAAAPCSICGDKLLGAHQAAAAGAPDIDAAEQEQPHHVDEVPVPGGELEAEMLLGGEMAGIDAGEANDQENRPDDDMSAVESGRHEERRAVDVARIVERRVAVLEGLHAREGQAEQD